KKLQIMSDSGRKPTACSIIPLTAPAPPPATARSTTRSSAPSTCPARPATRQPAGPRLPVPRRPGRPPGTRTAPPRARTRPEPTPAAPPAPPTPRRSPPALQPPVTQRHLETEIANCVGGVVSPVLANLFLHYAFDNWMAREFPGVTFELYVDDAVVHCASQAQAHRVLAALQERTREVGLELHPDKTRIVYCKDSNRRGSHEHTAFTFLGFTFRGREVRPRSGKRFTGFNPAISNDALKKISRQVRSW